jgi:hypothetical protein
MAALKSTLRPAEYGISSRAYLYVSGNSLAISYFET